jgi:hypothetical protein
MQLWRSHNCPATCRSFAKSWIASKTQLPSGGQRPTPRTLTSATYLCFWENILRAKTITGTPGAGTTARHRQVRDTPASNCAKSWMQSKARSQMQPKTRCWMKPGAQLPSPHSESIDLSEPLRYNEHTSNSYRAGGTIPAVGRVAIGAHPRPGGQGGGDGHAGLP